MGWRDRGTWDWRDYGERRPAAGIRAQAQRGKFGRTWWSGRWLAALERLVDEGRLSRGRSYARSGQVTKLDAGKGSVEALVQGSREWPYEVSISFRQLSDAEWEQVEQAMAAEAIYAAKLLSGEMPREIENAFAAAGATLFPASEADLVTECTCPDWANPCKHVAAVFYLLGERFDADPFLMFLLRGRSEDEVAAALRSLRSGGVEAEAEAPPEPAVPLLEGDPSAFWLPRTALPGAPPFDPPLLDALPVKSLGPPQFWPASPAFAAVMEDLYRAAAARAREAALGSAGRPDRDGAPDQT